jgi:glycosyltransferase involved in cell wall biosynthesis
MYKGYRLGIVVPAYNEEKLISDTLKGMPDMADRIFIVDDASADSTGKIVSECADKRVCLLTHTRNQGVGAAITTGYRKALEEGIDIAVVMAGDNQMDASHLPALLRPIIEGKADYAKGNRLSRLSHRHGMSPWRFFGNWLLSFLTKLSSGYWRIGDPQNGYTAITRQALRRIELDELYPRYGYPNDMLVKLNVARCRVEDVPMPSRYGKEKSKIRYGKFITTVAPLLLRGFLWRLKAKYLVRERQPMVYARQ